MCPADQVSGSGTSSVQCVYIVPIGTHHRSRVYTVEIYRRTMWANEFDLPVKVGAPIMRKRITFARKMWVNFGSG